MSEFNNTYQVGGSSSLLVAIQGPNNDPALSTLFPLAPISTKSFSIDGNMIEISDNLANSGFTTTQLAKSSISLSVSGNYVRDGSLYPNYKFINDLVKHRFNSAKPDLSQSPTILVKYVRPDVTITAYMNISSISIEDPDAELSTFSMELTNAAAPLYPPMIEDTI